MPREAYVKPEIKTEILEPEALCSAGSPVAGYDFQGGGGFWGSWTRWSWWW